MVRRLGLLWALVVVLWVGAAPAMASAKPSLPFYAIGKTVIKLPRSVQPWLPVWAPNGRHVVFENQVNGTIWSATTSGHKVSCLTCSFRDAPKIEGGFDYVFPDERRMFISHQLGASGGIDSGPDADAWVLECQPSLYACRSHRYLPVDMSQDKVGKPVIVQRRTWHLAPDGVHLGWMEVRLGATLMVVGKLQREANKYMVVDQRVVNPPGPATLNVTNPLGWANAGQLYELKSFADGGRSVLAVAEPQDNPDVIKIDLATGHVTQLTHNRSWDEDGAISPNGQLYTLESARTRPGGVQALGWIPQLEPFFEYPLVGTIALSGSGWIDYQCDLSPWLLPSSGDDDARLIGQPLETYPIKGEITAGDQLAGQQMWSPDSTGVLMQETTREYPPKGSNSQISQLGLTPHRIVIARIHRPPAKPLPTVSSSVGSWAPAPQNYHDTINSNSTVTLHGKDGTALLSLQGSLAGGRWSVAYRHFSQDGKTFLDGTETATGSPIATFTLDGSITVSGANTGSLHAALTYDDTTATHTTTGYYHATYDGRVAPPITKASLSCYRYLPHNTRLRLQLHHESDKIVVTVRADIHGDDRPVSGAVIRLGNNRAMTTDSGQVTLPALTHRSRLTATAGYTFTPTSRIVTP